MKTSVRFFIILAALIIALSFVSYTSASVDDGISNSTSPAQHPTPVLHPTPVGHTTPTHSGRKVGVCVRPDSANGTFVYVVVDEEEIGVHQAHGDIIGVSSQHDCPTAKTGGNDSPAGGDNGRPLTDSAGANSGSNSNLLLPVTGGNPAINISLIVILFAAVGVALLALSRALSKRA